MSSVTSEGKEPKLIKMFDSLATRIDNVKSKASTPIKSDNAFIAIEKEIQSIYRLLDSTSEEMSAIFGKMAEEKISFLPKEEQKRLLDAVSALKTFNTTIENSTKKSKELIKAETDLIKEQGNLETKKKTLLETQKALNEASTNKAVAQAAVDEAKKRQNAVKAAEEQLHYVEKMAKIAKDESKKPGGKPIDLRKEVFDDGKGGQMTLAAARGALKAAENAAPSSEEWDRLNNTLQQTKTTVKTLNDQIGRQTAAVTNQTTAVENARQKVKELTDTYDVNKLRTSADAFNTLRQKAQDLGITLDGIGSENTSENVDLLKQRMEEFVTTGIEPANRILQEGIQITQEMKTATDTMSDSVKRSTEEYRQQNEAAGEVKGLLSRIKQFTGLTGAALIARRALQNAISTIKELDKQMTEMAVVTNLKVGDYWKQLPEHTERANALGMAIKDVYEAETLYYQQGLKTAQVTQLSTSTLKMARIAGLSAEDATNKMTAALRGFNMEINQTNADRIADVYSKLAAITASNVREISTAMTKTASLAANAGMEFETTAAFLSQIIETTRESAETAGTALKTVIARFQELKKAPEEIGEIDGEIVDANKIETALRTVGVALRDTQGQFRDLDDVFIELAGKWDTLDTNTQRYIATIAAGSRQQSRFIAMMSNYSRTQELVTAANNAAGASNEQFEKTLDSLESKLAALKNAWDTFTMGLANNEFIKMAVDALIGILNALNKISQGWDAWSSSVIKIGLVTAALVAGDKAIKIFRDSINEGKGVLASFGSIFEKAGNSIKTFAAKLTGSTKSLKAHQSATIQDKKVIEAREQAQVKATAIENQVKIQEKKLSDLRGNAAVSTEQVRAQEEKLNKAKQQSVIANEAMVKTQEEEAVALGFNATEYKVYNDLVAKGIATDTAAILVRAGLTAEDWANAAAKGAVVTQTKLLDLAEKAENATGIKAILLKTTLKVATINNAIAAGNYTGSALSAAVAQFIWNIHTALGISLTAALCVTIGLAVLAVAALIAIGYLLVKVFQAIKANTPEGKLKTANEQLKTATENATAAKEAYDGLKESLTKIQDKYDALNNLVVGTREWREALLEVNGQVLELLDKYPELAKYVTNENGILKISDEGMDAVLELQSQRVGQTQAAQYAAQITRNNAQQTVNYSKLSNSAIGGNQSVAIGEGIATGFYAGMTAGPVTAIGGAIAGAFTGQAISKENNRAITDTIAKAMAEGTIGIDENGEFDEAALRSQLKGKMSIQEIDEWVNTLAKDSGKAALELARYGQQIIKNEEANRLATQGMINSAAAMVDSSKYTQEQITQMCNMGTKLMDDTIEDIRKKIEKAGKAKELDSNQEYLKYFEDIYGKGKVKITGSGAVQVKNDEDKWETKLGKESARSQYVAGAATAEYAKRMELLPIALSKVAAQMGKEVSESFNKAFNNDQGEGLSRSDLNNLEKENLEQVFQNNKELQQIYENYKAFEEEMLKRRELADQAFTQNQERLEKLNLGAFEFNQSLSAGAEKGLIEHLSQVVAVSGPAVGEQLGNQINELLKGVAPEELDKLVAQLNAVNWHDADALDKLPETLKEVGINLPQDQLEDFITNAKDAAHAISKIDFTKLNEQILTLANILTNIKSGTQGRTFSDSDYKDLITANKDLTTKFSQNLDGTWTYLGTSMDDLRKAIEKNTASNIAKGATQIQNKIDAANILDDIIGEGNKSIGDSALTMATSGTWSEAESRDFIKMVIDKANETGKNLDGISEKLSNQTRVDNDSLSKQDVQQIINDLRGVYKQQLTLGKQLATDAVEAWSKSLLAENVYRNAVTEESKKAETGNITRDEAIKYWGARDAALKQAESAGLSEQDIAKVTYYHNKMTELEAIGETTNDEYKRMAAQVNKYLKTVTAITGYQNMRIQMKETIERNQELIKSYKETTDEIQRMFLVKQMMQDFDVKITEDNYEYFASLTNSYLQGEEESFKSLINLAGQAAGLEENVFENTVGKTIDQIADKGTLYKKFIDDMIDRGYAAWGENGELIWGLKTAMSLVDELVEKAKKWESPYTWLYNANKNINALMKQRNLYEKDYQRMLEDHTDTYQDIENSLTNQVNLLQQEANANQRLYNGAKASLEHYMQVIESTPELASLQGAIAIGAAGQIVVDKDKLAAGDISADEGSILEKVIGEIEEQVDTMNSALDSLNDNVDTIRKLSETGKDSYKALLEKIKDGLEKQRQEQIDKLSKINDSIKDAQSNLVDKIQESIEEQRQTRNNAKAEQAITDKQARLAYLKASGGSQLEVLKLQKEIAEDQEVLQDSLIDQSLNEIQKANEKAAEQRQEQIDIAQAQLDYWKTYEAETEADKVLKASLQQIQNGETPLNTQMGQLLIQTDNVASMAPMNREDWEDELSTDGNLAAAYLNIINSSKLHESITSAKESITSAYKAIKEDFVSLSQGNTDLFTKIESLTWPNTKEWDTVVQGWLTELRKILGQDTGNPEDYNFDPNSVKPEYTQYNGEIKRFDVDNSNIDGTKGWADYSSPGATYASTATYGDALRKGYNLDETDPTVQAIKILSSIQNGTNDWIEIYNKAKNENNTDVLKALGKLTRKYADGWSQLYSNDEDSWIGENFTTLGSIDWNKYNKEIVNEIVKYTYNKPAILNPIDPNASSYITRNKYQIALNEDFFKEVAKSFDRENDNTFINALKAATKGWDAAKMISVARQLNTPGKTGKDVLSYFDDEVIGQFLENEVKTQGNKIVNAFWDVTEAVKNGDADEIAAKIQKYEEEKVVAEKSIRNIENMAFSVSDTCFNSVQETADSIEGQIIEFNEYLDTLADDVTNYIQKSYEEYQAALKSGNETAIATAWAAYQDSLRKGNLILQQCGEVGQEAIKAITEMASGVKKSSLDSLIGAYGSKEQEASSLINEAQGIWDRRMEVNSKGSTIKAEASDILYRIEEIMYATDDLDKNGAYYQSLNKLRTKMDAIMDLDMHPDYKKYFATGGLADFTGPAWMDGTPSAPELVLNATDTANFIALKDILSEIMRGSHERAADQSSANGNNYYDIRVEVDSIDSDYGVDQAADRIKELIEEDAMYRNVTAVNKTR